MQAARREWLIRLRRRVHLALDSSITTKRLPVLVHRVLMLLIVLSVAAMVLESMPQLAARWSLLFHIIEVIALVAFSVEYLLRFWSAPEDTPYAEMDPWAARWTFALTPMAIIDLMSVIPLYFTYLLPLDLRVVLVFRLLRYFKLARYSPGMRSLAAALKAEHKALGASAIVLLGAVLVSASMMHLAESHVQPDKFGTIPDAMWWAVVTLTTVGYGDVVPATAIGRIIAGFTMVLGLMMLALPVGIVATAFTEEIHKREFVVTWGMLARVPLFSGLSAQEIAELMRYLRAQTVPPGALVVRRGDKANCMYFIAAGEVEVEIDAFKPPVRLGEGHFFGEVAMLHNTERSANVRATIPTKLLLLAASDVQALMERNPDIRERIEQVAEERQFSNRNPAGEPPPA